MTVILSAITITDWLLISSTLLSPFLAVFVQKKIEEWRAAKGTKIWIFKTLMGTRGAPISANHVQALNMIDLEFSGGNKNEKEVRRLWKEYLDHLASLPQDHEAQKVAFGPWLAKNDDYLADLLVAMGECLGYSFDRVYIKKGIYVPLGHSRDEAELRAIRIQILKLLSGEQAITTHTALMPIDQMAKEAGVRLMSGLIQVLEGQKAIAIKPPQAEPAPLELPKKVQEPSE